MVLLLLPPVLSPDYAASLRARLLAALDDSDDATVDGARVASLSTPCLQVLLAAGITAQRSGKRLILRAPSPELVAALDDFGLSGRAPWQVQE